MKIKEIKKLSKARVEAIVASEEMSKSSKIKELFHANYSIKEIANLLSIRYNFAYNVISNYINMNDIEIIKEEKSSKKNDIVRLYQEGKSLKEISIELKSNYNYVHKIIKEYKLSQENEKLS